MIVVERLDSNVVARAEERLSISIPDRKREVAEEVMNAAVAPALIGGEDEGTICDYLRGGSDVEGVEESVTVVDPGVCSEHAPAVAAR